MLFLYHAYLHFIQQNLSVIVTSIEAKRKFTRDISTALMLHKEKIEDTSYINCFLNNFHTIITKQYNSEQV